jgi:N-acetylneuraminate lyase
MTGLIAATPTPFDAEGQVALGSIEPLAEQLSASGVAAVFVCGTTGECSSLTVEERRQVTQRWRDVLRGSALRLVVHVGSNCLADSAALAAHAAAVGADAVAALTPNYFKPRDVETLVQCMRPIASQCSELPFYFYDIPSMTGVGLSMPKFLDLAAHELPNLVGLKFTNTDMTALQHCLQASDAAWEILWGVDEVLLAAWALGVRGAVGSSYNFTASLYLQALEAAERGDLLTARQHQYQAVERIELLARYGYLAALKYCLSCRGVPMGSVRLPMNGLTAETQHHLHHELLAAGLID